MKDETSVETLDSIITKLQDIKSQTGLVSNVDRQATLMKAMFKYRRHLLEHLYQLWNEEQSSVLSTDDIIELLIYSQEQYGSVDLP